MGGGGACPHSHDPWSMEAGMADRVGWGILSTGKIAVRFADDLRHVPGAWLAAVGSRTA